MSIVDKTDALASIQGRTLEIGCGPTKIDESFVGVDLLDFPGVDVVGEIREVLSEIGEGMLAGAYSSHCFEHVDDVPGLLGELGRVIRPGGTLEVVVPHFSNPYFYSDPTHRTTFGLYSFSYLASDKILRRQVPSYCRNEAFLLKSVRLRFKSLHPFYGRYAFKRPVEVFVNSGRWMQEFYEENLCYLLPCYELQFVLKRVKPDCG